VFSSQSLLRRHYSPNWNDKYEAAENCRFCQNKELKNSPVPKYWRHLINRHSTNEPSQQHKNAVVVNVATSSVATCGDATSSIATSPLLQHLL